MRRRRILWVALICSLLLFSGWILRPSYQYAHYRGRIYILESTVWNSIRFYASCSAVEIDGAMRKMHPWNILKYGILNWRGGESYGEGEIWHGLGPSGQDESMSNPVGSLGPGPVLRASIPWYSNGYSWRPSDTLVEQASRAILKDSERWPQEWCGYGELELTMVKNETTDEAVRRIAQTVRAKFCSYNEAKKQLQNQPLDRTRQ